MNIAFVLLLNLKRNLSPFHSYPIWQQEECTLDAAFMYKFKRLNYENLEN